MKDLYVGQRYTVFELFHQICFVAYSLYPPITFGYVFAGNVVVKTEAEAEVVAWR